MIVVWLTNYDVASSPLRSMPITKHCISRDQGDMQEFCSKCLATQVNIMSWNGSELVMKSLDLSSCVLDLRWWVFPTDWRWSFPMGKPLRPVAGKTPGHGMDTRSCAYDFVFQKLWISLDFLSEMRFPSNSYGILIDVSEHCVFWLHS